MSDKPNTEPNHRADLMAGKKALVIGASKGIGRQCALSLAACGAKVVALARSEADLRSLCKMSPLIQSCVTDATTAECLLKLKELPTPDILVNNLGGNTPQAFVDVTDEALESMFDMNIISPFRITRQIVRGMLKEAVKGSIINISSQMGHVGSARNRTVYCSTKHALEGFTKALAVELAPEGIRVNSVAPTFIDTPMSAPMLADPEFREFVLQSIPLGTIGNTEDVANAVIYLASDASRLVTGASIKVDGGWTAQ